MQYGCKNAIEIRKMNPGWKYKDKPQIAKMLDQELLSYIYLA